MLWFVWSSCTALSPVCGASLATYTSDNGQSYGVSNAASVELAGS